MKPPREKNIRSTRAKRMTLSSRRSNRRARASFLFPVSIFMATFTLALVATSAAVTVEMDATWTDWAHLKKWEYTPPLVDYNLRMGVKGYLTRDFYSAIIFLKEFIRKHPHSPYADYVTYYLSMSYKMVELEEQAIFNFKKLLYHYPDSPFSYYAFIELEHTYFEMGEYSSVIEHYQQFRSIYPISIYSGRWVTEFIPNEVTYLVGQSYYISNDLDKAEQMLERMSETTTDFLFGQYTLGLIDYQNGRIESALDHFQQIIRSRIITTSYLDPIVDKARLTMGRIFYEQEQFEASIEALLEIDPRSRFYIEALDTLAWALIKSGNRPLAISYLNEIISIHPTSDVQSASYALIGRLYTDMDDAGGGIVFFEQAKQVLSREIEAVRVLLDDKEKMGVTVEDLIEIHHRRRFSTDARPMRRQRPRRESYYPKSLGFEIFYRKYLNAPLLMDLLTLFVELERIKYSMSIGDRLREELNEIFSQGSFAEGDEDVRSGMVGEEALWTMTELQQIYVFSALKLFDIENRCYDILEKEGQASDEEILGLRHGTIESAIRELWFLLLYNLSVEEIAEPFTRALTRVRKEPANLETREKRLFTTLGRRTLVGDLDARCAELAAKMKDISASIPYRSRDLLLSEMILYSRNLYMLREISEERPLEPPEPVRLTVDTDALAHRFDEIKRFPPLFEKHFMASYTYLNEQIHKEVERKISEKIHELSQIDLEIDFHLSRTLLQKAKEDLDALQGQ